MGLIDVRATCARGVRAARFLHRTKKTIITKRGNMVSKVQAKVCKVCTLNWQIEGTGLQVEH